MSSTESAQANVSMIDAWAAEEARVFFRNVWPLYLHEISAFDTDFYTLDRVGRWTPDLVEDWLSAATPLRNLRSPGAEHDRAQPFQRTHVIARDGRPVGFVCIGMQPFKYMPAEVDQHIAEFFLIRAVRGTGIAERALAHLLARYSGRWHLGVIHDNARALRFWRRTLRSSPVRDLEERVDGRDIVFRFTA